MEESKEIDPTTFNMTCDHITYTNRNVNTVYYILRPSHDLPSPLSKYISKPDTRNVIKWIIIFIIVYYYYLLAKVANTNTHLTSPTY